MQQHQQQYQYPETPRDSISFRVSAARLYTTPRVVFDSFVITADNSELERPPVPAARPASRR